MVLTIAIDYFSRYVDVAAMQKTTKSSEPIRALKSVFARHGIPQVRSDNGSQYRCMTFADCTLHTAHCTPQTADPIDEENSTNSEFIINISRVR